MVRHGIGSRRQLSRQGGGRQRQNSSSQGSSRRRERASGARRNNNEILERRRPRNNGNVRNDASSANNVADSTNNNNINGIQLIDQPAVHQEAVEDINSNDETLNAANNPPVAGNENLHHNAANFIIDDNGLLVFANQQPDQQPGAVNLYHNENGTAVNENSSSNGFSLNSGEDESDEEIAEIPTRNTFDALFVDEEESSSSSDSYRTIVIELESNNSSSETLNIGGSSNESDLESTSTGNQSESSDDDDDVTRCAICFLKDCLTDNWRRLMTLPCCGKNGREETSSTRFCAACMLHLATDARPDQIAEDEYPHYFLHELDGLARNFYGENDCQTPTTRFIHCPRCKDICVVDIKDPVSRLNVDWTKPTNASSISLRRPKFKEKCQFVGKKVAIAPILLKVAFLHHRLIPLEALVGERTKMEDVHRLVKWKILKIDKNNLCIFTMKKGDHNKLKRILGLHEHSLGWCLFIDDILRGLRVASNNQLKQYHFRNSYSCPEDKEGRVMAVIIFGLAFIAFILATILYLTCAPVIWLVGYIIYTWASRVYLILQFIIDAGTFLYTCILSIPLTVVVGVLCGLAGFSGDSSLESTSDLDSE